MFDSLTNRFEFFSDHYLDARLANDLTGLRSAWDEAEGRGEHTARVGLRGLGKSFFTAKAAAIESTRTGRATAVRALNDAVLRALGFTPDRVTLELDRNDGTDHLIATVATSVRTSTGLLLVAIDAGLAQDVDELFDVEADSEEVAAGLLLDPLARDGGKHAVPSAGDAPGAFFSLDDPPRFVLVLGGTTVLLAERSKWAEGRFLAVDLDAAVERADSKARGELETIAALFSADSLVPGAFASGEAADASASILDQLTESSQKHAVGVSKELRDGMRHSIEILANEVIEQRLAESRRRHDVRFAGDQVDAKELTKQCLRYLYRLIVLLYAESRPELGVLPTDDDAYLAGYSLDRLRELVLVDLDEKSAGGSHLSESLELLFDLVNHGYHAAEAGQAIEQSLVFGAAIPDGDTRARSTEDYLQFPGLDATIFDPESTPLLNGVTLRNEALQRVLALLMLNKEEKGKNAQRGFISYAQLGINQLGAVYEGLMAYSGFFADRDLYEVAKGGDPSDGTWMVGVDEADEYPGDVFVIAEDPITGVTGRVRHQKGSYVYRLAGRDRQRSASYYTPEVLTQCVVRHALAELLGTDDHARVPGGSAGITEARQILDLTICEPALGSGAFLNEAINQLSAEYLKRRQAELGETLDAERFQRELQKVKAHFALHQSYGVDLNATAVELAEVSLWLNSMHPGLKAPWFGLQLRQGNSLIGCRRATWRVSQLKGRVWARDKDTAKATVSPPVDRPLADVLEPDEIHHFLLPGHGWGAVSARKEAKELAPEAAKSLAEWRKAVLGAPLAADADRLVGLAAGVERLWAEATDVLERLHARMRRPLGLYGTDGDAGAPDDKRQTAEAILANPDSALGRLRLVMDAWVGLWFWPLASSTDAAPVVPPSWREWLDTLSAIIGPEPTTPSGQLDLFADLETLAAIEEARAAEREPINELLLEHRWLSTARELARREAAWHWELEFAPLFFAGGFDLQVGNPPWVRLDWKEDLLLAESDPWWGLTEKAAEPARRDRRSELLGGPTVRGAYLLELASAEGLAATLGSPQLRPLLAGLRTNLYMAFMDTVWRHASELGIAGLLHPESHFVDPEAGRLREHTYPRLRRMIDFKNVDRLFEDVHHLTYFSASAYGAADRDTAFLLATHIFQPSTLDASLAHDGSGPNPTIQYPTGGWDYRPHRNRLVTVDLNVLADWARLFDEPGTRPQQARLLRPVTRQDLEALGVLADAPVRLADHEYAWTQGWNETNAKTDGFIRWETATPPSLVEVILQGPHFTVATPFSKQPNENCRHNQDYEDWNLERLPRNVVPRTNYQRSTDRQDYDANLAEWNGQPLTAMFRHIHREMTQPGLERTIQGALLPPGPAHVLTCQTFAFRDHKSLGRFAGIMASIPADYMFKAAGAGHVAENMLRRLPFPMDHSLDAALVLRTLRLNCLTADYAVLWDELFDQAWIEDGWTNPACTRVKLGDVSPEWTMETPLRRDAERRIALVELDAIAAIMLGLTSEQLCAMYRTQFAVLRKYEYAMAFDAEGRKICQHHQSAGYRQTQLQEQAKNGERGKQWKSVWSMFLQYEEDPDSVDWEGQYTAPFTRVDREAEMTRAYNEFQRRLAER